MRARLIWLAVVLGASYFILSFIVGEDTSVGQALGLAGIRNVLNRAMSIVLTMALAIGVINLFQAHGASILRRRRGWGFSVVVFVTFFTVVGFMVWEYQLEKHERRLSERTQAAREAYEAALRSNDPQEREQALANLTPADREGLREFYAYHQSYHFRPRTFYLQYFINPLAQTVMALLGFYITYAAYRAFRLRSLEATVMMLSAAIMILGSDPVGGWLSATFNRLLGADPAADWWVNLPAWADFDNRVMMSGMQRGLAIGIAVATIAASLRILLGLEKGIIQVRPSGEQA